MDAGIATEDNINWLKKEQYHYLVVSRKRHREFSEKEAVVVKKDKDCTVKAYKKINDKTGEVELYCHSTRREDKERAIYNRFSTRFEEALDKLDSGLHKKGCVKKYDKVLVSLGRLKQKYSRAAKNYRITVNKDKKQETLSGSSKSVRNYRIQQIHIPAYIVCVPTRTPGTNRLCGGHTQC